MNSGELLNGDDIKVNCIGIAILGKNDESPSHWEGG